MRWGVPDGIRDQANGSLVHDDDLITAALWTELDALDWSVPTEPGFVPGIDPLIGMDNNF